jgi:hypothetical protein
VLVDVRLADRLRGQVQILDLLELARTVVHRFLAPIVRPGAVRRLIGAGRVGRLRGTAGRARRIGG